ncbi:MAG: BolA family protein [Alphaproteobacteria bacterium]
MQTVAETIRRALDARFRPLLLSVADDSAKHAGHEGAREGGESHFSVTVVSAEFSGLSRVARHRLVYDALGAQFARGLHALSIRALTPEEMERSGG